MDDTATVAEDDRATTIDVLANDTDVDNGGPISIDDGHPAGERDGGHHQRRRRAHLRPDPNYCNDPTARHPADMFTYSLDAGRRHRHRGGDGDLCG